MRSRISAVVLLVTIAAAASAGCDPDRGTETRTYQLEQLQQEEATALVRPYIADGEVEGAARLITVRESPERLDRIEELLARYDRSPANVTLHFQIIEANGASEVDPEIAEVEAELRELFRFEGYRLAAEARVRAAGGGPFGQTARGGENAYHLRGEVREVRWTDDGASVHVAVDVLGDPGPGERRPAELRTSVNARSGQTVVLGSAQREAGQGALIVVMRAEVEES